MSDRRLSDAPRASTTGSSSVPSDVESSPSAASRRCPRRPLPVGGARPSDLLVRFFAAAIAFLLAAVAASLLHEAGVLADGRWLALHLAFLGGVSQLVLGAGQFFVGAFLATDPPPRLLVRAQLACWNAGTILVAVGVPTHVATVSAVGGALIAAGLVLFAVGLRGMQRRSLQRARWAVRWYYACAGFLGAGVLAGLGLALGVPWPLGSLLGAHLALSLAGWFGTAIAGTLHTFHPSLTQTQLRFARLQGPTFTAWTGGTAALAAGLAFGIAPIVFVGWLALGLAAGLLIANLAASLLAAPRPLSLPARLITVAQAFLLAGVALGIVGALGDDVLAESRRAALAVLLLAGWLGLTVLASLLHLLAVLARVRDLSRAMPLPRPARTHRLLPRQGARQERPAHHARSQEHQQRHVGSLAPSRSGVARTGGSSPQRRHICDTTSLPDGASPRRGFRANGGR